MTAARRGRACWTALGTVALLVLVLLAYAPALDAGFVWDDDYFVTDNETLRDLAGLRRIWTELGARSQYYPLVFSSFWLEYRLWGLRPAGYHAVNIALHALNAALLWFVLRRLSVPGAWVAAAVFAVHPVHVESVAWITERKNVLSGLFYLSALLCYLRFCGIAEQTESSTEPDSGLETRPVYRFYALSLTLFAAALLSKTVTCTLPVILPILLWWRHGRIRRHEALGLLPMLVLGFGLGLLTVHMERAYVGARGAEWHLSFWERLLVAGRVPWFYAGKLLWPSPLIFNYPRWQIDGADPAQLLWPAASVCVFAAAWLFRREFGRAPVTALAFFFVSLAPALGFFNVYPMQYAFVADHFQYLASIGPIVLATAGAASLSGGLCRRRRLYPACPGVLCLVVLAALGAQTWRQSRVYKDLETLWLDTLSKNPQSFLAHDNLGCIYMDTGALDRAEACLANALAVKPRRAALHYNLGLLAHKRNRPDRAMRHYAKAIRIEPRYLRPYHNLGVLQAARGQFDAAIGTYTQALAVAPNDTRSRFNMANAFRAKHEFALAVEHYSRVLQADPRHTETLVNLGITLAQRGALDAAIAHFSQAAAVNPADPRIRDNLAKALELRERRNR